jgi:hypothetical protein
MPFSGEGECGCLHVCIYACICVVLLCVPLVLPVYLSVHMSIFLVVWLSVCLSANPTVFLSGGPCINLFMNASFGRFGACALRSFPQNGVTLVVSPNNNIYNTHKQQHYFNTINGNTTQNDRYSHLHYNNDNRCMRQ